MEPRVTFGIVNCNRLHYLKSCLESLIETTHDYPNREFIIVDNASIEEGTKDYLDDVKERLGATVIIQDRRDPDNEFARALNLIYEKSTGKYVIPLQGDMQFIIKGKWLKKYVDFMEEHPDTGCIMLDAQRRVTNSSQAFQMSKVGSDSEFQFVRNVGRPPFLAAADVMYSRKALELFYPWEVSNKSHEGGEDSETKMLLKVKKYLEETRQVFYCVMPIIPVSVAIYTDSRGTNARVRGNRRYGDYWAPKDSYKYYFLIDYDEAIKRFQHEYTPVSIEDIALPIGWYAPLNFDGSWKKNPIRPETAKTSDYVELESRNNDMQVSTNECDYIHEWLND